MKWASKNTLGIYLKVSNALAFFFLWFFLSLLLMCRLPLFFFFLFLLSLLLFGSVGFFSFYFLWFLSRRVAFFFFFFFLFFFFFFFGCSYVYFLINFDFFCRKQFWVNLLCYFFFTLIMCLSIHIFFKV